MLDFKFDWDTRLELDIPSIDEQHQHFFKLGRHIEQLLLVHCAKVTDQQLLNLLYELRDYVTYHFYEEERFMREINYPELAAHELSHKSFLNYINAIDYTKLCEKPYEELTYIHEQLVNWVFSHMVQEDQKITPYYKNKER